MGNVFKKNHCIVVFSSIFVLGLQNAIKADAPFQDTGPILDDIILRPKRQYDYYGYDSSPGYMCYNCTGTITDCGRARVETDDKMQCFIDEICVLSQQTKSSGKIVYHRYCDNPRYYMACSSATGFACELYQGEDWCDECCKTDLCNSMQWTYGISTTSQGVTTTYSDGMSTQTQSGTPASQTTMLLTTPSVSTTSLKSSTSLLMESSTTTSMEPSTGLSTAPTTTTSMEPSTSLSPAPTTITSMEPSTSSVSASSSSPSSSSSTSTSSEISTSTSYVSSTSTSLATSTPTTQEQPSNQMSCYKCTGTLVYCGLSREPSSEMETCDASVSQCYVQWEAKPNGLDTIYKRGCLSSPMVNFDVNKLCPRGILKGCVDNVCAMCCNDNLCNSMLWFYSSAPSQQVTFMRWIWVLVLNLILTYIFV